MNIGQYILENILTEGIHLYAFVKDEEGNSKIIEDLDYPNKDSFKKDLQANGYKVYRINDEKDMYIMDNSDYRSVNELTNRIKQIEKDIKNGIALPSEKQELDLLKDLLNKVLKESLNESKSADKLAVWKAQIENNSNEQLLKLLNRLYRDFDLFNFDNEDSNRFYILKSKIDYLEQKLNLSSKKGRILR